jgi:tetratricopeptide (TPR) repeat protein
MACCLLCLAFMACRQDKHIVQEKDIAPLLQTTNPAALQAINNDINFWQQKLKNTPAHLTAQSKIASLLARRFAYTGAIADVHAADSLYAIVNKVNGKTGAATFRALAANAITQHRFRAAQLYADSALIMGDNKYQSLLIRFDAALELGDVILAGQTLQQLGDKNSFDYLIRAAKYKDQHDGDLDGAIVLMEKAFDKIKADSNPTLYSWAQTNLGDMYGHANRYADAYRAYLTALQTDPHAYHALKGIAWLAFSHDKNYGLARRVVQYLQAQHPVPDYALMLAGMVAAEGDTATAAQYNKQFLTTVRDARYGDMYNKYIFYLYADALQQPDAALSIAQTEVSNRPTPASYSLLAWAHYRKGDVQQALRIVQQYTEGKCFEPDVLFQLGLMYRAAGDARKARQYLREAAGSSYELGPVTAKEIEKALQQNG